jgi:RNA polymerase sigma-70 factor (ECF subfamily)
VDDVDEQVGAAARLVAGDASSWEALYRQVYPAMIAYAERRLGMGEEARDAVSEALTRAVAGVDRLSSSGATPQAWFFGILRHVVIDQQRWNYRHRSPKMSREIVDAEPVEVIVMAEEALAVRTAFEQLPEHDREVLELRVVAGLSSEETGSVLGMQAGAVRMAQARALDRLRAIMMQAEEAPV